MLEGGELLMYYERRYCCIILNYQYLEVDSLIPLLYIKPPFLQQTQMILTACGSVFGKSLNL